MTGSPQGARRRIARTAHRVDGVEAGWRYVPEEVPVAFSFYGTTYAVMMASPADLEEFALGFCLGEGIVAEPGDITDMEVIAVDGGIDIQMKLADAARKDFTKRERRMAGPVGCGLCGVESIEEALRPVVPVKAGKVRFSGEDITRAVALVAQRQPLNRETRAVHAAGFYVPDQGIVAVREDVGRHNALDKLAGALADEGLAGRAGAVVLTSRVSVEMVQKTARLGVPLLIAISAPTALALEVAEAAGICLAALVRGEEFELFTHPELVSGGRQSSHVA